MGGWHTVKDGSVVVLSFIDQGERDIEGNGSLCRNQSVMIHNSVTRSRCQWVGVALYPSMDTISFFSLVHAWHLVFPREVYVTLPYPSFLVLQDK